MIFQTELTLKPYPRGFHLITHEVIGKLEKLPEAGLFHLFIKHTSAGLTVNENADPSVLTDFETIFNRLVPENQPGLRHTMEGADDMPAHIKAAIVGNSITLPITNGRLDLGTWQGIYLCEFRNYGGSRKLVATMYS
ncbi:MAG: YjbQ family protein [Bacteroidetes bacterium]|nr:YjbQ family protein [Bacteroidota bacterium]